MEFNEQKPGALAIAEDIAAKRTTLDSKHIILTDQPGDVAAYLSTYCHTMNELVEIGPWSCYEAFRLTAGKDLPRLYMSFKAKAACVEELANMTDLQRRANYLFSYEDTADWIYENIQTDIASVVVPLSMFSTDPDAFRSQFEEERRQRFVPKLPGTDAVNLRTKLYKWKVVRHLPADIQGQIGQWHHDYKAERERQGVAWPNPTSLTLQFPKHVLARYKTIDQLELTRARGKKTVLYEGLAVHRYKQHINFLQCRRFYTPGLLLGDEKHWRDYELGLVDLMSIPRAVAIFGEDFLKKCPWRLKKDDVVWTSTENVINDVTLNREFRLLLGLRNGR